MTEPLSPRNPQVVKARLLARDRKERASVGLAVFEGVRLAEEALSAGVHLEYVLYSDHLAERDRGAALLEALRSRQIPAYYCTGETLAKAADTQSSQGILLVYRPRVWQLTEIPPGLTVVLDNLQDPGNLGTIVRSVEAMGGAGVVVAGGVDPHNPKVVRSAMGSLFRLPVVQAEITGALTALRARGSRIYLADAGGRLTPWSADLQGSAALVIGNEGAGPSAAVRACADGIISIPMPGLTESLNAGVAASLLIYEAMRQRSGVSAVGLHP